MIRLSLLKCGHEIEHLNLAEAAEREAPLAPRLVGQQHLRDAPSPRVRPFWAHPATDIPLRRPSLRSRTTTSPFSIRAISVTNMEPAVAASTAVPRTVVPTNSIGDHAHSNLSEFMYMILPGLIVPERNNESS